MGVTSEKPNQSHAKGLYRAAHAPIAPVQGQVEAQRQAMQIARRHWQESMPDARGTCWCSKGQGQRRLLPRDADIGEASRTEAMAWMANGRKNDIIGD